MASSVCTIQFATPERLSAPCLGDKAVYESTSSFCGHDCGARDLWRFLYPRERKFRSESRSERPPPPIPVYYDQAHRDRTTCGNRLLGVGTRRLLLGARHLGVRAAVRVLLDARILELERIRLRFIGGYWGPQVGYYGGINYGGGYYGNGYVGGYWRHNSFVYNAYVTT